MRRVIRPHSRNEDDAEFGHLCEGGSAENKEKHFDKL